MSKFSEFFQGLLSKLARVAKAFISQALPTARLVLLGQLEKFTKQVVLELNDTNLNNDERRNVAFNKIKGFAVSNGLEARDSLIHAAIALAVLSFKTEF